ncbi:DUF397 domain-containing protein [Nonomuraea phyllanthi]|uniref:DUF397 domain-containing protein n=1 Tax=Nonomuraea phyllanthi TaxID=2219224 RepID=UPI0012933F95|nr:DUF397 domain-containing protein [Nonomuraea phyllanthi]QFY12911.1 DUF397 domain-containing protein [Nonomuraea phyllanthi]
MTEGPSDPPELLNWRKSSASATGECVEVAFGVKSAYVRDSNSPAGAVLAFSRSDWVAFVEGVRRGEFDWPEATPLVQNACETSRSDMHQEGEWARQ